MVDFLKKVGNWILWSSSNPESISLTLKSGVPFLLLFLSWSHFGQGIDAESVNNALAALVTVIVKLGEVISAVIATYGLIRKIILSLKG